MPEVKLKSFGLLLLVEILRQPSVDCVISDHPYEDLWWKRSQRVKEIKNVHLKHKEHQEM